MPFSVSTWDGAAARRWVRIPPPPPFVIATGIAGYLRPVVERKRFGGGCGMDTEGFRDKADDAITQGEEEVDERTGGRFDEQTDRATDEVRERGEGILGDQQGDEPQQ
jgi:hypothetical protein